MANTYSKLNIHAVFTVQGQSNILNKKIRKNVFEYISGTMKGIGVYPLVVNGYTDHIHVFFELPPHMTISNIIQEIKANSSKWINDQHLIEGRFRWQEGFGVFSYARSQRQAVIQYIMNQENHHKTSSFKEEYLKMLQKFDVDYNEEYIFKFYN